MEPFTPPDELTSAQKSGRTKKQTYDTKVRIALQSLIADPKRKSIFILDICANAGVSSDPLDKEHHKDLRAFVDAELANWTLSKLRKRGKRPAVTEIEVRLQQLETDNAELRRKLGNAQRALNALGQMLESALSARTSSAIVPMHRPRRDA